MQRQAVIHLARKERSLPGEEMPAGKKSYVDGKILADGGAVDDRPVARFICRAAIYRGKARFLAGDRDQRESILHEW